MLAASTASARPVPERWRYQRPPPFEGRGGSPAVPHDIRGYEARVDGERVLYRRRGARAGALDTFPDVGPRIDVLDWQSEESTLAALELSAAKWGEFVVTGNEEFKSRCARLAAEHGFQITSPELQDSIERERARLGAAASVSVDPEPSPEPDVEPGGTPGRTPPAVDPPADARDSEPDDAPVPAPPILDAEVERHHHIEERREQMASKDDPLRTSSVVVPDSSVVKPPPSPSTGVDFSVAFRVAALVVEQRAQRDDEAARQPPAPSGPDVAPVRTPSAEEPPNRAQDLDGTDVVRLTNEFRRLSEEAGEDRIGPQWRLVAPKSWDRDVDRPHNFELVANGQVVFAGPLTVRTIGEIMNSDGYQSGSAEAFLECTVKKLDRIRELEREPER